MSIKVTITVEKSRRIEFRVYGQMRLWCEACGEITAFARVGGTEAETALLSETVHVLTGSDQRLYLCLRSIEAENQFGGE